ncbi:MAG: DUF2399 domain-containing protein [Acidimicrobiaceae bacterium]|nr:DUF2399 domain-containing protein [Acidimicrobiaceae bacterium]MYE96803.1 DUF2399 domain-containing protein [Acidimicrobiaceae bacterium]MYI52667.1 DUF2399 domain-containing protein [Acidimicrobiaceae bacterium]
MSGSNRVLSCDAAVLPAAVMSDPGPHVSPPAAAVTTRPVPESLLLEGLQPLWATVRQQLDRFGPERRGTVARPDLGPPGDLVLESLLGHRPTTRLDLADLEAALVDREIGKDLCSALTRLGCPPSSEAAQRRTTRRRAAAARTALELAVADWPEPWAAQWAGGLIGAGLLGGLDDEETMSLAEGVRRLLDRLDQTEPVSTSRTEFAAALFGSSHALDQGTRLASFVKRALRCRLGEPLGDRELWEASGVQPDRVSAPALAWAIPVTGNSPIDLAIRASTGDGLPLHVSLLAMLRHPLKVPAGTPILVVENPRLVEAAAERELGHCVVATNGNPTTAVTTLVQQLRESGARLWYHGDFDAAGIAICRRMHDLGCSPWMMGAVDYQEALIQAERDGVRLDRDSRACGPTPWDPTLEELFGTRRLIVHEEFVLDRVLDDFPPSA